MEANVKKETDRILENETKEWLNKTVSDTFDEFFMEISAPLRFHKSEEINRDLRFLVNHSLKIYDFINSYHAYCKLCEQHFYSRSVANDINSFFQKHINTSYHKQSRKVNQLPDDVPMLLWNEKFLQGKCNVCDMSNLDPFIIDTKVGSLRLMNSHVCVWDEINRQNNEKVLKKINLLKKYCRLKICREKYIKTVDKSGVCLLCGIKLPWPAEKASCHLDSDGHYQNFCLFVKKYFGFTPKDLLNGFNLETVTRWLINHHPPVVNNFIDCRERELSLRQSNSPENPYLQERTDFSFSPKIVLKSEEADFIYNGECLICNVPIFPGHTSSELHRAKALNLNEKSFTTPIKYAIYCENRRKRLRMIENFERLKMEECYEHLPPEKDFIPQRTASQVRHIDGVSAGSEIFCEVCDISVSDEHKESHVNSNYHKFGEKKWDELKESFSNEKFMETFLKIKNSIVCLLCWIELDEVNFFSHLKNVEHTRRFVWYSNLNLDVPVSSVLSIGSDLSCYCTKCNKLISRKVQSSTVNMIELFKLHRPCLSLKEKVLEPEPFPKSETAIKENHKLIEENQNTMQDIPSPISVGKKDVTEIATNSDIDSWTKDTIDFKKVEKTLGNIMKVFERKMINTVVKNMTTTFIGSPNNSRKVMKEELTLCSGKKALENIHKESSSYSIQPLSDKCPPSPAEDKKNIENKGERSIKNEINAPKSEIRNKKPKPEKSVNKNSNEEEEDHEVLLIEGLPSSKRKYKLIYTTFRVFGEIRYLLFNARDIIVAFVKPGVAAVAAQSPKVFVNCKQLTMKVSTWKSLGLTEKKQPSLNRDLINLLKDCQKLMDFMLNLVIQAVTLSESLAERKREELVCNTIIKTILEDFPQARCYPFGSRLSGLMFNSSDLDVFLDCGNMYEGFKNTSTSSEKKLIYKVAWLLRNNKEITEMIVVDRARVPIVSFLHRPTFTRCDVSFKNGLSIHNTLLIKYLLSLDWRVRPLILFLKHWAKVNGLHGPPYFSSYAIAILVIYYLEQLESPVLPTIESLQNSYKGRRITIAGWDCSINMTGEKLPKLENKDSFPALLMGLFKFYANFDYKLNVISPLYGKLLPRELFSVSKISKLPMCYKRHILNIPLPIENLVNDDIVMCVMDPFDLSYIPTKSLTQRGLKTFVEFCQTSENYLRESLSGSD